MSAARANLKSLRAKLHSAKGKLSKFFHRRQTPTELPIATDAATATATAIEMAPTATPATAFDTNTCDSNTPNEFSANMATAATALTPCDQFSSAMDKENADVATPVATPRIKIRLIPKDFETKWNEPNKKPLISKKPETSKEAATVGAAMEIDELFALYLAAVEAFTEAKEVAPSFFPQPQVSATTDATAYSTAAIAADADADTDAAEHSPSVVSLLQESAQSGGALSDGVDQVVCGNLELPELCTSPTLSDSSYTSSTDFYCRAEAAFLRYYEHPKQLRKRYREKGLMAM